MRNILLVVLVGVSSLSGCGGAAEAGKGKTRRGQTVERVPKVEVVHLTIKQLTRRLDLACTVEPLQRVDLCARVPGVVDWLPPEVDIGRFVKKGDVLVKLAVPELVAEVARAEAMRKQAVQNEVAMKAALDVSAAEVVETEKDQQRFVAEKEFARLRYMRIRDLVKQRAQDEQTAQEALRQYEAAAAAVEANTARTVKRKKRVESAQADLELAKERIKVAEAEKAKVQASIDFATIRAPFDGVITRRGVDVGATIKGPDERLLTMMHLDQVRVLIDVPQRDAPLLNDQETRPNKDGRGDHVILTLPSLSLDGDGDKGRFDGYVTRTSRSLDPVTRTMRAEVVLENKKDKGNGYLLRPGMFGTASLLIEERSNVMTLPATAIVRSGDLEVSVYRVVNVSGEGEQRQGVLRKVRVELGIDDGKEVEVREQAVEVHEGKETKIRLTREDLIVARATSVMRAGEKVQAVEQREGEEKRD